MRCVRSAIACRCRAHAPGTVRALAALAVALGLGAPVARAGEGLYLSWNNCAGGSGVSSLMSTCDRNDLSQRLYCAFTLPQPLDNVLGIEMVVDLQSQAASLPDWWHLEPANLTLGTPAGCRYGSLSASQDFTGEVGCVDFWQNRGTAIIQGYAPGAPYGGTAQARIKATAVLPSPAVVSLDDTHTYYGLKLVLDNARTVDPGLCYGCLIRTCLVLNAVWVKRTPGAAGGDRLLETPGPNDANWAIWNGTESLDCLAVPVRRVTWGQLKSLYR